MKQIFVLNDLALATNKQLSALGVGEMGCFGFDANGAWTPIDDTAVDTKEVTFAIGNGTVEPFKTMRIAKKLKHASLTKSEFVAEVLPKFTIVASVSGYTSHALDSLTVDLWCDFQHDENNKIKESFEVILGSTATPTTIHAAIAAKINELSENFTAVATGATNVVITANKMAIITQAITFNRYSTASATTAPVLAVTLANGTQGVATPSYIKELVEQYYHNFGQGESYDNRYGRASVKQAVAGSKYTLLEFSFVEDRPTGITVDTDWTDSQILFACDVSAEVPTTLVADIEDFIEAIFGVTV